MKCTCGGDINVMDGRMLPDGYWRRRKCVVCGEQYTTLEQFCETVRGTRTKQPVVKAVKPPRIEKVRPTKPEPVKKELTKPLYIPRKASARNRIEDMKWEKENASVLD